MHSQKLLLFLIFLCLHIIGMQSKASDKAKLFEKQTGEKKIETGLAICDSLSENPEEMLRFSLNLVKLAQKSVPNSKLLAQTTRCVADAYYYIDSLEKSNEYLLLSIQTAESLTQLDSVFIGAACNDLGLNLRTLGNLKNAKNWFLKAIDYLQDSYDKITLADSKSNLATLFHAEGDYEQAINLFQEVYQIDEQTGNKDGQSSSLNNLGRIYVDWGKYETGLEYYFRSLELIDTLTNRASLAIRYNNIGMTYQTMKQHENAILWINKALKIEETIGNPSKVAMRLYNLATSHASLKNYQTAQNLFERVDSIISGTNLYVFLAKNNAGLGQLYFVQNRFNEALNYFSKAENFAGQAGTLPEQSNVALHFYQIYKKMGNYSEALSYYEKYTELNDSIYSLSVANQIEELQIQHQTAQKEAEITRLETDNEIKQNELIYRKRERNWAFAAILILLGFSFSLYLLLRQVKIQKTTLSAQNAELDKLNKTLNRLFGIISHDLRNASAAFQSSSKIIAHHLKNGQPEKLVPLGPEIEKNSSQLTALLENLLNWSAAQIKGIEPEKKQIDVDTAVEKCVDLFQEKNKLKNNQLIVNGGKKQVFCDPESFQIILRNLLGNAVKYTTNGSIIIQAVQKGNYTEISVSDTGCGMDATTVENLNRGVFTESRRGTLGEKGTGLGLILVAEHVKKNNGTFKVESTPDKGTTVYVNIPCCKP